MNMTLKLTLDGLINALRWRQLDFHENPSNAMRAQEQMRPNKVPTLREASRATSLQGSGNDER